MTSAILLQSTAMLPIDRCHTTLSPVKNPYLCDAAFHQNSLTSVIDDALFGSSEAILSTR